ncbi:regulator [Nocardia sp. NPDC055321]
MTNDRRIQDLTAQAADTGLMDSFLAGTLIRGAEPADAGELPVPDAAEVESAAMVPTTVRFSKATRDKLAVLAHQRGVDVSSLVRGWVDHQIEVEENPDQKLITVAEAVQALQNLPHSA